MQNVSMAFGSQGPTSLQVNGTEFLLGPNSPLTLFQIHVGDPSVGSNVISGTPLSISTQALGPGQQSYTYFYSWGTSTVTYIVTASQISVSVTISSNLAVPITRWWMYPFALNFPVPISSQAAQMAFSIDNPAMGLWSYSTGVMAIVDEDNSLPLAIGLWPIDHVTKWFISLNVDPTQSLNSSWPAVVRPIPPGSSDTLRFSLRFGDPGTTLSQIAWDAFAAYAAQFPISIPTKIPHGPIARLQISQPLSPISVTNPRGWFGDPSVDVTTAAGLAAFRARLMAFARNSIAEMQRIGSKSTVVWDIEGSQLPVQRFVGSPDQAEVLAPELVGIIDQFFGAFTTAGITIGCTVRPQEFNQRSGTAFFVGNTGVWESGSSFEPTWVGQTSGGQLIVGVTPYTIASVQDRFSVTINGNLAAGSYPFSYPLQLNTGDPFSVLVRKARYAQIRWGAMLFYIDSTVDLFGNLTLASVYQQLGLACPGGVFIPETVNSRAYCYGYPFIDGQAGRFSPAGSGATAIWGSSVAGVIRCPSDAIMALPSTQAALLASVQAGSELMWDGWFRHPTADIIQQIYAQAG